MRKVSPLVEPSRSPHESRTRTLAEYFERLVGSRLAKYLRLRMAVFDAIHDGGLQAGDQIPPEQELCRGLAISLGTVQRALGQLMLEGVLLREHGRGTFVAQPKHSVDEVWQLKFRSADGSGPLPVYSTIVEQDAVDEPGPWSEALGADPAGCLRIARVFSIDERFRCFSHFYVGMTRFAGLRRVNPAPRESVNLKRILAEQFNAPTLSISQTVRMERFDAAICDYLSVKRRTKGLVIEAVGHTYGAQPVSFHVIWVPPTTYRLDMTPEKGATSVSDGVNRRSAQSERGTVEPS